MEKSLSPEEKWRRAEELYYQRKRYEPREIRNSTTINVQANKDFSLFKKMIIQIILCICIYSVFYFIQNANNIFSQQVLNKTEEILSYDINFDKLYQNVLQLIEQNNAVINEQQNSNELGKVLTNAVSILNIQENKQIEETLSVSEGNNEKAQQKEDAVEENIEEEQSSFNQMEIDAKDIKANYSIIKPLTGTITSRFGIRNPTTETVPKYHTGIDIARADGSVIVAAMEGTVTLVSDYGDYRQSYKNNKWRCNDIICTLSNNICKRRR